MNLIEINNNLTVLSDGDVNHPLALFQWLSTDEKRDEIPIFWIQLTAQIFHTDLKHFDLKNSTLLDPDLRRPIYIFVFDTIDELMTFMDKHKEHLLAFQQVGVTKIHGNDVPVSGHVWGRNLNRLRSFVAWAEYITGGIESNYVQDCRIQSINGGMGLHAPEISFGDFIACLKEDIVLVKKEKYIDPNEVAEVDGVQMTADKVTEYLKKKAILEGMESSLAN